MYTSEEIVAGAQALRPHLPTLLGADVGSIDNDLGALLAQAQEGQHVEMDILRVVARYEVTRKWLTNYLKEKQDQQKEANPFKSLEDLPGKITALPLPLFRCPEGDYEWHRPTVDIRVPQCPAHHLDLIQVP